MTRSVVFLVFRKIPWRWTGTGTQMPADRRWIVCSAGTSAWKFSTRNFVSTPPSFPHDSRKHTWPWVFHETRIQTLYFFHLFCTFVSTWIKCFLSTWSFGFNTCAGLFRLLPPVRISRFRPTDYDAARLPRGRPLRVSDDRTRVDWEDLGQSSESDRPSHHLVLRSHVCRQVARRPVQNHWPGIQADWIHETDPGKIQFLLNCVTFTS